MELNGASVWVWVASLRSELVWWRVSASGNYSGSASAWHVWGLHLASWPVRALVVSRPATVRGPRVDAIWTLGYSATPAAAR
jgi:hypothetical protein